MYSHADGERVSEVIDADVVAAQADLAFVDGEDGADGYLAERVFQRALKEQQVWTAEAIVRVAGEHGSAVDVGAADGGREVERHVAAAVGERFGQKSTQRDRSFELRRGGDDRARERGVLRRAGVLHGDIAARAGAVVGAIVLQRRGTGRRIKCGGFRGQQLIQRNLVAEVAVPDRKST